jgi:peptide deformylase
MAVQEILRLGTPSLRVPSKIVTEAALGSPELQRLLEDMIDTMREAHGAGLAAPQIGDNRRVCVIELNKNPRYPNLPSLPLTVLVNPIINAAPEGWVEMYEGCLSVPGLRGRVRRPRRVEIFALGAKGEPVHLLAEGMAASVIQHEVDHLDGVLFVDKADPQSLTFLDEFDRFVTPDARFVDGDGENAISQLIPW